MFIAIKEMQKEKKKFCLIISIFVLIAYLVYFLLGLANGLAGNNRTAVDQWQVDQIVLAKGANNNIGSSMLMADQLKEDLADYPFELINLSRSAAYKYGQEDEEQAINLALIGLNPAAQVFPEIITGTQIAGEDEVIASQSLKEKEGLAIGDKLKLSMNGKVFKIVGFTHDYQFNVTPVIYTQLEAAAMASLINLAPSEQEGNDPQSSNSQPKPPMVSAALVYTDDQLDLGDKYEHVAIDQFIEKLPGYYAQLLTFGLMIGFLIIISAIVLGVFLYIMTLQKRKIFGIMKIQGISNRYIGQSVMVQTLLISLIGLGIGLGLTYLTELVLPSAVPFKTNSLFHLLISLLIILTAQVGAFFSVRSVAKVDPLDVI